MKINITQIPSTYQVAEWTHFKRTESMFVADSLLIENRLNQFIARSWRAL